MMNKMVTGKALFLYDFSDIYYHLLLHMKPAVNLSSCILQHGSKPAFPLFILNGSALAIPQNTKYPKLSKDILLKSFIDYDLNYNALRKMGVDTVVDFSGCPGDSENARYPNWVTCAWPDDFSKILK